MDSHYDVFIGHASEDKEPVVRRLARLLEMASIDVWLDEHVLRAGSTLTREIDKGLARSRFGIVVLSPAFFSKNWPQDELAGMRARRESGGMHAIIPVWYNITKAEVAEYSPVVADWLSLQWSNGAGNVAREICRTIFQLTVAASLDEDKKPSKRLDHFLGVERGREEILGFLNLFPHAVPPINNEPVRYTHFQWERNFGGWVVDLCIGQEISSQNGDGWKLVKFGPVKQPAIVPDEDWRLVEDR